MSDLPSDSFGEEAPLVIEKYRAVLERANDLVDRQESGAKATFDGPDEMMVILAAVLFSQGYHERYPGQREMNPAMDLDALHGTAFASGYMLAKMEGIRLVNVAGASTQSRNRLRLSAIAKMAIRFGVLPKAFEVGDGVDPDIKEIRP